MAKPLIYGTFFEHLDELRKSLIISLAAFFIALLVPLFFSDRLLDFLVSPLAREVPTTYFFSPADAFIVKIKVSILAAMVLSAPVVLGQLWSFISPALYGNEKKAVLPLIFVTTGLFLFGAWFSFKQVIPVGLHFLIGMQTDFMKPMVSVSEYLSFLTSLVVAFGVAFNLPVFILALVGSGVVSAKMLHEFQRYAILLIFIAAAVLTPGPDIASQLLLAVPLLVLFELSVLGAIILEKARVKKSQKAFSA
jgi:sec-independent protein translocase protein TatC